MAGGRTYRTLAIVLDKTKLRETDLIFTLLAENGRQLRAVGKGARKPGSRLAARCELGCKVDLLLAHGRSLDVVAEATLVEATLGAAPSYELLSAASALADVAKACCFEDAEDPFVYQITLRAVCSMVLISISSLRRTCLSSFPIWVIVQIGLPAWHAATRR